MSNANNLVENEEGDLAAACKSYGQVDGAYATLFAWAPLFPFSCEVQGSSPSQTTVGIHKMSPIASLHVKEATVLKRFGVQRSKTARFRELGDQRGFRRFLIEELKLEGNRDQNHARLLALCTRRDDRLSVTIQSVTGAILIASSGAINTENLISLRKYLLRLGLDEGTDEITHLWKEFANRLQNTIFDSEVPGAPRLTIVPKGQGVGFDCGTEKASELADLVMRCSPAFILDNTVVPNSDQLWWVSHLVQTRMFPNPSMSKTTEKIGEYVRDITSGKEATGPEVAGAFNLGIILGMEIRKRIRRKKGVGRIDDTHLSLTSGSCIECSRSKGGKWHTMQEQSEFIEFLLSPVANLFRLGLNNRGQDYYLDSYGNTVAPKGCGAVPLWSIGYLEDKLSGDLGDHVSVEGLLDDSLAAGFDVRLGRLLFEWATLKHREWKAKGSPPPAVKVIVIVEPGGKIRPLTSGETWVYLYMVPAMHVLKDHLELLPGARTGLTMSDQLWRFGNSYQSHQVRRGKGQRKLVAPEVISSSDLTAATDRAEHKTSSATLKGMALGIGLQSGMEEYIGSASDLLCSPRSFTYTASKRHLVQSFGRLSTVEIEGRTATFSNKYRGVLMGEAITKALLTAASMGAFYAVRYGFRTITDLAELSFAKIKRLKQVPSPQWISFACCGDDHVCLGPREIVAAIPAFQESMYYEISWPKYRISSRYCHYCQDFGIHPAFLGEGQGMRLDIVRLRLYNQFAKMGGQTQFESPDPLIGKAREIEKLHSYLESSWVEKSSFIKEVTPLLLRVGMPSFFEASICTNPITYVPSGQGGLGIPSSVSWTENEQALGVARFVTASRLRPDAFVREGSEMRRYKNVWERGLEFTALLHNFLSMEGFSELDRTTLGELFKEKMELSSVGSSTSSSRRRIIREIHSEYINLAEQQTLLGYKETPYAGYFRGTALQSTLKGGTRASKKLREIKRRSLQYKSVVDELDLGILDLREEDLPGSVMVSRNTLHEMLGIRNITPSLYIRYKVFEGKGDTYTVADNAVKERWEERPPTITESDSDTD